MVDIIIGFVIVALASGIGFYFIHKTNLFEGKRNVFYIVNLIILVLGVLVLFRTEQGPMQGIYVSLFYVLALLTVVDIFKKEIHLELFICIAPIIIANQLLFINEWDREKLIFTGGTVLFLLLIGFVFRKGIGFGDILLFILLILALELNVALFIIIGAFTLSAVFGIMVFATRRAKRGTQIPFTPFIFACYMLYIIL